MPRKVKTKKQLAVIPKATDFPKVSITNQFKIEFYPWTGHDSVMDLSNLLSILTRSVAKSELYFNVDENSFFLNLEIYAENNEENLSAALYLASKEFNMHQWMSQIKNCNALAFLQCKTVDYKLVFDYSKNEAAKHIYKIKIGKVFVTRKTNDSVSGN